MSHIDIIVQETDINVTVTEEGVDVDVVVPEPIQIEVTYGMGPAGPQGDPGAPGAPGVDGGELPTVVFNQEVASDHWVIPHTWPGGFPSVTIVDTAGRVITAEVLYTSPTQVDVYISPVAVSGKAFLN